jgi:hypothetical protein
MRPRVLCGMDDAVMAEMAETRRFLDNKKILYNFY